MREFVDFVFSCGLFFNAILFIPQAYQIWKQKSSKEVSLFMFLGFNIMQLFTAWHAWYVRDYILMFGFLISLITCGAITFLAILYRKS